MQKSARAEQRRSIRASIQMDHSPPSTGSGRAVADQTVFGKRHFCTLSELIDKNQDQSSIIISNNKFSQKVSYILT